MAPHSWPRALGRSSLWPDWGVADRKVDSSKNTMNIRRKISWPADKPLKLTPQKQYVPKEYDSQVSIFEEAAIRGQQDERWNLLFATLNGVRLPIGLAKKMKRAGNKQGVPDMFLPVARRVTDSRFMDYGAVQAYGLWIELKREKGGVLSESQRWWHQQLTEMGYRVVVAKGAKEAIRYIEEYLAT